MTAEEARQMKTGDKIRVKHSCHKFLDGQIGTVHSNDRMYDEEPLSVVFSWTQLGFYHLIRLNQLERVIENDKS